MGIPEIRQAIDHLDNQILEALNRRAQLATDIGELKKRESGGAPPAFFDPERELRILERLQSASDGRFPLAAVPYVFREIISACRSLETPMKIAYLGPAGTFTQIAAARSFGESAEYLECATIPGVFEAVERGQAQFGVVPFENSGEGGVRQTMRAFVESELHIRSETVIKIDHCLVSKEAKLVDLRKVYSHPQALSQCRRWIHENLPGVSVLEADSTAAAAKLAANEKGAAAVASRVSAERFGLQVLRENIQDQAGNSTRFVVVSHADAPPTGRDRTSLWCVFKDESRALGAVIEAFDRQGVKISRFESQPHSQEKWKHHYFVDVQGHRSDAALKRALAVAERHCTEFRVFGSYPVGLSEMAPPARPAKAPKKKSAKSANRAPKGSAKGTLPRSALRKRRR